ncbi:ABC transporter permease subunit [Dactylosporangium matsuzakiense]|uniref:Polysaccharide ABC transporter ATP-binding protein n=1 Tax=Dactylosporangium matsuzakiense TaxID=53360 RepID=A0A9W6KSQ5_9ACTN|nr:ABC transporter permease subunit [Dactylosporangium matsuzakiense]GLL05735.1 polysaccharide ABC transporter ATP-binding protein [Dactylosporangium matsuzakiense]
MRRDWPVLLMMVPGVAYFLVFQYGAMFGTLVAFKDYVPFYGFFASAWVGIDNFTVLTGDEAFWLATLNTIVISGLQLVFFFPAPLALALLLHSLTSGTIRRFVQSVVYLPHFISWVIVVAMAQQLLGGAGLLNGLLSDHGLHTVNILADPGSFKPLMVAEVIWKDSGWGTIIFLAALTQVDEQLYEASAIDGAGPWRRFWHVTLPAIRPIIVLLLILRLGDILSVGFEQILLQRDAVGPEAGEVIDTFVYYHGIVGGNFGLAAAAGLAKGVIGACLVYAANKISHRLGEQGVYR